ncbi:MAG TPA: hypothetical protein VK716_04585 [Terracidiphilus sp.]|jgi:hypothetical protein|nr:hypothetical protein [Terracidiphilus sp.]
MKHSMLVGLGLVLSASFLSAQYAKPAQNSAGTAEVGTIAPISTGSTLTVITLPTVTECPVVMQAKQGSGGGLIAVRGKDSAPQGPSQHVHLIVTDGKTAKVTEARVRVFGFSGKGRMQNAAVGPDAYDFQRTMDVTFSPEGKGEAAADLVLPGFTAVNRVVLQTISYDDGSTWRPEQHQSCAVTPDPLMLVAGR